MYDKESAMLSVRLDKDLEARLDKLAKETGRSKSYYARQAIEEKIQDMEDIARMEKVIGRIESGEEAVFILKDIKEELGLER